jgi:thiosulfate/3-mercaptopyruvate sulfurtransferase
MQKRLFTVLLVVALVISFSGMAFAAGWANPDLLMTAKEVKKVQKKSNWVILDCRKLKDYAKGHIPGAISLGKRCKKPLRDATSRAFSNPAKYEKLLGAVGIGNDTHVVIYGEHVKSDTIKDTAVAFWVLEYIGLKGKTHVLNGGIDAWINEGFPTDNKPTIKKATTFKAKMNYSAIATTAEILKIANGKSPNTQLIDSRSAKEHKGKDIRAVRGGHVPNTLINVSHKKTFDQSKDPKTGKMKDNGFLSYDRVNSFFKNLDRNKRTIGYCQTGTRSTLTYLELRLLGFTDAANWDESWRVYGSHPDGFPIDDEQFFNFAGVNKGLKKIKKLEKKIKALEEAAK